MTLPAPLLDPFRRDDPRSIINIVPQGFADALLSAYRAHPEWFGRDEKGLYHDLKSAKALPNATDNRIRMKFWMEYEVAQSEGRHMNLSTVAAGLCSYQYFHSHYIIDPSKMAWLMVPPASYEAVVTEALHVGLEHLRGVLAVDPVNHETGKVDVKLAELQAKIVGMLDMRAKGAIPQKIMNLHANLKGTSKELLEITEERSMEALEKRLQDIERKRAKIQGQVIGGNPVPAKQREPKPKPEEPSEPGKFSEV